MSDTYISIVPTKIEKGKAAMLAEKFKSKLITDKIISKDCTPSENVASILVNNDDKFKSLENNKLEIVTNRKVFENGGNGLVEITCSKCDFDIIESNWMDAVEEWYYDSGKDDFRCPNCSNQTSITEYLFNPQWGFSELGFTFWNWPEFTEKFVSEIENLLGSKVGIVYGRI
ncbi:hypothetical protein [Aquimarina algiphila]|uniref:Sugar ABC transporter ATPase n=1 Tax=Aquimarina algiphila TaxID=2047982 RepID=A0A554VK39_9FLAO|nr:hypothetical protein [Aquimarina algiphila]TSE08329.1 hypothetical protein FOF46_13105 [Aquimarina algiphila]